MEELDDVARPCAASVLGADVKLGSDSLRARPFVTRNEQPHRPPKSKRRTSRSERYRVSNIALCLSLERDTCEEVASNKKKKKRKGRQPERTSGQRESGSTGHREREGVLSWPHRSRPRHVELAPAEIELDLVVVEGDDVKAMTSTIVDGGM